MAVARDRQYLNRFAAEALGQVTLSEQQDEAARFLCKGFDHPDALYAAACIRGYTRLLKRAAAPELIALLGRLDRREDGHRIMVGTATVEMLGLIQVRI